MKIRHTLNEKGNISTRKVRGTYVEDIYSGEIFEPDDIAISISEINSNENVWISFDNVDRLIKDFNKVKENNFKNVNKGFTMGYGLEIGEYTYVYKYSDKSQYGDYNYKCSYCGKEHDNKNIVLYFSSGKPPYNKVTDNEYISKGHEDKVIIDQDCINKLFNSFSNLPDYLKAYNTMDKI